MLINEQTEMVLSKVRIEALYAAAERGRVILNSEEKKNTKPNKVVSLILNETGKALINTGNRLLKIA